MKKFLSLVLTTLIAVAVQAADVVPSFNATLTVGNESRFVLLDADGKASSWLKLGDSFAGYTVKAYDAKAGALDLEKDGKTTRVSLAASAAVAPGALASTTMTPATVQDATAVLEAMHFEKMLDRTLAGVKKQQMALVDRMMAQMLKPGTDRTDVVAFQQKMIDTMMSALNGADLKDDVAKMYSQVFSKEELQALGSFYASPLGQAFSDKQPVIAEKMNEIMMPRMMAVMPQVQQMAREFAAQQKAKVGAATAAVPTAAPAASATPKP